MGTLANGAVTGPSNENVTEVLAAALPYTVVSTDQTVQVTTGTPNGTVNLPAPVAVGSFTPGSDPSKSTVGQLGNQGQRVTIQKIDAGAGTVTVAGTLNIGSVYTLANQWSAATFLSDGTRWNLLGTVS